MQNHNPHYEVIFIDALGNSRNDFVLLCHTTTVEEALILAAPLVVPERRMVGAVFAHSDYPVTNNGTHPVWRSNRWRGM